MSRTAEWWYPILAGIAGVAGYGVFAPTFPTSPEAAPSLFSAVISTAAIAVGFLATAKSILLSIDRQPVIVKLKAAGKYKLLVSYLVQATIWSFLLAGTSVACFLPDLKNPAEWHRAVFAAWTGVMFTASAACFRVIHAFGKVLHSIN